MVLWYHQEMSEQKSICSLFSLGKIEMLRSCSYCGKIHDKKIICPQKKNAIRKHQCKSNDKENKFRWSGVWKRKAEEIKKRDRYLCQACLRQGYLEIHDLSVHHIVKLRDDFDRRLDNDNLITLCRSHHEQAETGAIEAAVLHAWAMEQERKNV